MENKGAFTERIGKAKKKIKEGFLDSIQGCYKELVTVQRVYE